MNTYNRYGKKKVAILDGVSSAGLIKALFI